MSQPNFFDKFRQGSQPKEEEKKKQPPSVGVSIVNTDPFSKFRQQGGTVLPEPTPAPSNKLAIERDLEKAAETLAPITQVAGQAVSAVAPFVPEPVKAITSKAVDVLSRGQFASARFIDSLIPDVKKVLEDPSILVSSEFLERRRQATKEAINEASGRVGQVIGAGEAPKKLSFSKVIQNSAPEFAKANPKTTAVLGFGLDIAADPTTYLSLGTAAGAKTGVTIGGRALSKAGKEIVENAAQTASREALPKAVMKGGLAAGKEIKKLVRRRTNEIDDLYKAIGVTDDKARRVAATKAARLEVLSDIRKIENAEADATKALTGDEITERIEQRIARAAALDPKAIKPLLEPKQLAIKVFPKTVFFPQSQSAIPILNVDALVEKINKITGSKPGTRMSTLLEPQAGRDLKKIFVRDAGLPTQYVQGRVQLQNDLKFNRASVAQTYARMLKDVDKEGVGRIQKAMGDIETKRADKENSLGGPLLPDEERDLWQEALGTLKPKERAFAVRLMQDEKRLIELELRTDLLRQSVQNFDREVFDVINNGNELAKLRKLELNPDIPKTPDEVTKIGKLAEAESRGLSPEIDYITQKVQRIINLRDDLSKRQLSDITEVILPEGFKNFPQRLQKDIQFIGDGIYPREFSEGAINALRVVDKVNGALKRFATIARVPAFAARQLVGGANQALLEQGLRAQKVFDPRALLDGVVSFVGRNLGKPDARLPAFINNVISRNFAGSGSDAVVARRIAVANAQSQDALVKVLDEYSRTTVLGEKITGRQLYDEVMRNGVMQDTDSIGNRIEHSLQRDLGIQKDGFPPTKVIAKLYRTIGNLPAYADNYNRVAFYSNARVQGYTEKQAANLVKKTFFDYTSGLSRIEARVFNRMLFFYSYTRFSYPQVFKKRFERPGTLTAPIKFYDMLGKLFSDNETLTEPERELLPPFLIEQPNMFRGFDDSGRALATTIPGTTPVETFNLIQYDRKGNIDWSRTFEKSFLGALVPYLKVPIETLVASNPDGTKGRQFFNDRPIATGGSFQPSVGTDVLTTILPKRNDPGYIAAMLPKPVKDLISWEERPDPFTGKTKIYVNPYAAYTAANFVPFVNFYIKAIPDNSTPLEAAMELILGVGNFKLDLKKSRDIQNSIDNKEYRDALKKYKKALTSNSPSEIEKAQADVEEILQIMQENFKRKSGPVRGPGTPGIGTAEAEPAGTDTVR